jgi:hypothetical protein
MGHDFSFDFIKFSKDARQFLWNMCEQLSRTSWPDLKCSIHIGQVDSFRSNSFDSIKSHSGLVSGTISGTLDFTSPRISDNDGSKVRRLLRKTPQFGQVVSEGIST